MYKRLNFLLVAVITLISHFGSFPQAYIDHDLKYSSIDNGFRITGIDAWQNSHLAYSGTLFGTCYFSDTIVYSSSVKKAFVVIENSLGDILKYIQVESNQGVLGCTVPTFLAGDKICFGVQKSSNALLTFESEPTSYGAGADLVVFIVGFDGSVISATDFANVSPDLSFNSKTDGLHSNNAGTIAVFGNSGKPNTSISGNGISHSMGNHITLSGVPFVTCINNQGTPEWMYALSSTNATITNCAIDNQGNTYVIGYTIGNSTDLDYDPISQEFLIVGGGTDSFILKIDPNGDLIWHKHLNNNSGRTELFGLQILDAGIAVHGTFTGHFYYNPDDDSQTFIAKEGQDTFVSRFSDSGDMIWAKHISGFASERASNIALVGSVLVSSGTFNKSLEIDGLTTAEIGDDFHSYFLATDLNGNFQWLFSLNARYRMHRHIVGSDNQLIISKVFINSLDLDPSSQNSTFVSPPTGDEEDNWLISKYNVNELVVGCSDVNAQNYIDGVTGSNYCIYAGCTDSEACNFNLTANVSDGSCEFLSCVGCTYVLASNYNPNFTIDDGSCEFEIIDTCQSDINLDCSVDVADLVTLLSEFGVLCNCHD